MSLTHGFIFLLGQTLVHVTGSCTSDTMLFHSVEGGYLCRGYRLLLGKSHGGVMYLALSIMTRLNITQIFAKIITPRKPFSHALCKSLGLTYVAELLSKTGITYNLWGLGCIFCPITSSSWNFPCSYVSLCPSLALLTLFSLTLMPLARSLQRWAPLCRLQDSLLPALRAIPGKLGTDHVAGLLFFPPILAFPETAEQLQIDKTLVREEKQRRKAGE